MRAVVWAAILCGCGRIAFDPLTDGNPGGSGDGDARIGDGGGNGDASGPMIACADVNLGSTVGSSVYSGMTSNANNASSSCGGVGFDTSFGWFAPVTGTFQIDDCVAQGNLDSTLSVRMDSCAGAEIACGDDQCGSLGIQSRVTVNLTAGQGVVIILDETALMGPKPYTLAITQL